MASGILRDFVQQEGGRAIVEIVVKQQFVRRLENAVVLIPHDRAVNRVGLRALAQELQDRASLSDLLLHAGEAAGVIPHHVADHVAEVRERVRIVTDVADSARRQVLLEDRHHLLAHVRWYPRVHAVRDDVVELSEAWIDIHDVAMEEFDVAQAQRSDIFLAALDRHTAQVDTDELAVRILKGHGQKITADAAAEFKYSAALDRSRLHAVDGGNRCEMVGVSP